MLVPVGSIASLTGVREAGLGGMLLLSLGSIRSAEGEYLLGNLGMVVMIVCRAATGVRGGEVSLYFVAEGQGSLLYLV